MNYKILTVILSLILSMEIVAHPSLIIENITLIDAENPVRFKQTVLIEDGKIQSIINPNESIKEQENSHTVIDGSGKFLIPGLWDAHVHLTFIPEIDHETYFNLFLKNGITSIRAVSYTHLTLPTNREV